MSLAWRLALRDLRGGLGGLKLLVACLLLGVGAIAGIGSLSAAILAEIATQGRAILGGDLQVTMVQRQATPAELTRLAAAGRVSRSAKLRAMASRPDGGEAVLAELKAVDAAYPLYGMLRVDGRRPGGGEVAIAPALAERLRVRPGQAIVIGTATLRIAGLIAAEPDRAGEGFALGPAAITDLPTLARTGLIQPGSLYQWRYRIAVPPGADVPALKERLARVGAPAGWQVQDARDGAPGLRRSIERIGQFLTLLALASLVIAGIGVGNGVGAYLEGKRAGIATLKTLGASQRQIVLIYLIEVGLAAGGAILLALAIGALVPGIVAALAGPALPVPPRLGLYPWPLAQAALYGLLVTLAFALPPLGRARLVSAASLFRGPVERRRPPVVATALAATMLALAALLAIVTAREPGFAAGFLAAAALLLGWLAGLGLLVRRIAAALPRPRRPLLRLALATLHAPAARTDRLVVALGLGLSLVATLAVIETALTGQLRSTIPARAPSVFMLDIPAAEIDRFRALAARLAPAGALTTVPSLRGPIVALNDVRVADMKRLPEGAWVLRGDRGLTFSDAVPDGDRLVAGRWWPAGYAGPPLVSIGEEAASALDLGVGDRITVSALGVEVPARIASIRTIDWDSLGFNFVLVFSPNAFTGAPFTYMATLALPPGREEAASRAVTRAFPSVSVIRVSEVIATISNLTGQLAVTVAAAASVTIAAGIAVLIGAIAAARRARLYDAVLLKLLGATRAQVLLVQAFEHALLAGLVSLVALAIGAAAGWYVMTRIFTLPFAPDWGVVALTLAGGALLTLAIGLLGALPVLRARPAEALRTL